MEPVRYDLKCKQGATFNKKLRFKDGNGNVMDLAGFTARMQVRETIDAEETLVNLTMDSGVSISGGFVSLTISAADTSNLPVGSFKYDLEIESADGTVYCPIFGGFKVAAEVTR